MQVKANGIDIEVEDSGGNGPAVLLVMGLGMQLTAWPPELVQALVQAGYRVIRHDNRDAGLSRQFDELRPSSVLWSALRWRVGLTVRAPYTLADMAHDARGVLDALGVAQAHVVGASMGGMIAQRLALAAPDRVLSLTSIMSSSGARNLPQARSDVARALMSRPSGRNREALLDYYVRFFGLIGSPGFPTPPAEIRQRMAVALARASNPAGVQRQMLAIAADITRPVQLARVKAPTLVIHGRDDPLVPLAGGQDTARRIPGARLEIIDGMGHDLPPGVVQRILPLLLAHFARYDPPGACA
ncbi:MAG TPA: alpha/beta fold hydrolase [Ottowia sp.]|uniref:alpha/beta fold hydrolase n=1 Tax=Ottowia sp. TaxID=1898956 RepID=UPI002CFB95EA|nr:alpha/beta fold hydrolase [Ottowia sp.]HMN22119.1 alpha/beta fold hydrolase [Ottowia sp.]